MHQLEQQHAAAPRSALADCSRLSRTAKRILDGVIAGSALALLAPLWVIIAVAIKVQDGGPVLHRRRVVGCREDFDALKFRSMRVDADQWLVSHPNLLHEFQKDFKLQSDPRVTPLGNILRRTSLDELPQLINVLQGQMSIVGPRMITRPELAKYGSDAFRLLSVRPGMTGYWQVFGRRSEGYGERVRMDLEYIDHWSLWFDLRILLLTPIRVLRGQAEV